MSITTENQAMLDCMNWLMTEKNCFRSAAPDAEMKAFFNETKKMLSTKQTNHTPDEYVAVSTTAAENFLLILTNSALYFEQKPSSKKLPKTKRNADEKISFVTTEIDYKKACEFLKSNFYTDEIYEYYQRFEHSSISQKAKMPLTKKIAKFILYFFLALLVAGVVIWLSGFFISPEADAPVFNNVFDQFGYWFHYDLLGNEKPVSAAAKWISTSHLTGRIILIAVCAALAIAALCFSARIFYIKCKQRNSQRWNAITNVFAKFASISEEINNWEE